MDFTKKRLNFNSLKSLCALVFFLLFSMHIIAQEKTISGVISDEDTNPLPGVNVFIKNTKIGTATDFDGNYSISANSGDILQISFVGFESQEIEVGDNININISMVTDYANLDEVVITGYGTTRKKDLVSSISQIKGDALENQPVARVDNMLQGRAAGVNVVSSSGEPGAAAVIRIRGMSSINGNNKPLFAVSYTHLRAHET